MHSAIKFNQEAWLKPYIKMKTVQRKNKKKNYFEKGFLMFMNNAVLVKTMVNLRKHKAIKLVAKARKNYLLSEPD